MNKFIITIIFLFFSVALSSQNLIYTVSGEHDLEKAPLDKILIENISNNTSIYFDNLKEQDNYQVNLTNMTVGVRDLTNIPDFSIVENIPGMLSLKYKGLNTQAITISIININCSRIYSKTIKNFSPNNLLKVSLGSTGIYFVKVETSGITQSFKAMGGGEALNYEIALTNSINREKNLKSTLLPDDEGFTYSDGDSMRISAFREGYYSEPIAFTMNVLDNSSFKFQFSLDDTTNVLTYEQVVGEISLNIRLGYANILSNYFNQSIELVVLDKDSVYNKSEAQQIINDFFIIYKPVSFVIVYQDGKENAFYAIGEMMTNNEKFRVYLFLKKHDNGKYYIHQIRIEKFS